LPRDGRILEAGCGNGLWVSRLRENGYDCLGVDSSISTLSRSCKQRNDLPVVGGDVTRLPFADETFSAYVSLGVIEHFRDEPQLVLQEARRVLKENAVICISTPFENHFRRKLELSTEEEAISRGLEFYQYYFQPEDLTRELLEAGFHPMGVFHRYYVNIGLRDWPIMRSPFFTRMLGSKPSLLLDFVPFLSRVSAHMVFTVAIRR
jgi:SAM-dependent methyltransferase